MKVYTLVITSRDETEINVLNVIMKTDPKDIANIIQDDYNDMANDRGNIDPISVTIDDIVNDAEWIFENSDDSDIHYQILVQDLTVNGKTVELISPDA